MIYLDSNFFGYAFLHSDKQAEKVIELLDAVVRGKESAATCALTYDEIVWSAQKFGGRETALKIGDSFLAIRNLMIIPVDAEIIRLAHSISKQYPIHPRDAIHAASCMQKNIAELYSEDRVFDQVKEIKRKWVF